MKKVKFIVVAALCFVLTDTAHAQRALQGMRGLEIRSGFVDGLRSSKNRDKTGYYFGAAMTTYAKKANKWVFGAEYLYRNYPYKDGHIPVAQFTAEGGYYYNFLTDGRKNFFFYIGASALAGYETVNWGEKLLYDGSTLRNEDRFVYGGALTFEADCYITDRVILLLTLRERMLSRTTTGHFHTQLGIGLKFMIN